MMKKNPFEVLGIHPKIAKQLSDEQLHQVVKSMYRNLQNFYHPDRMDGNAKLSQEINEAKELLEDKDFFRLYRERFVKVTGVKKRVEELEQIIDQKNEMTESAFDSFIEMIAANAFDEKAINNLRGYELYMIDTVKNLNIPYSKGAKSNPPINYTFYIDDAGDLFLHNDTGSYKLENKSLVGSIKESEITSYGGFGRLMRKLQTYFTNLDILTQQELESSKSTWFDKVPCYVQDRISPKAFVEFIDFISPYVTENSFIFSVNKDQEGIYFTFDGRVKKMTKK